jgi:hypothetical protein
MAERWVKCLSTGAQCQRSNMPTITTLIREIPDPPPVVFSDWLSGKSLDFTHRNLELSCPGIYVWAWFDEPPSSRLALSSPPRQIVYIGEAKIPLRIRMRQFVKSFENPRPSHAGGGRCGALCRDKMGTLFASWFALRLKTPESCRKQPDHWSRPFLHHIERALIWQYVQDFHEKPVGNAT